jgi:hypothetical protein
MKKLLLSAGALLLFTACKSNNTEITSDSKTVVETTSWLTPINALRIAPETFTFSSEEDKIIELETGSKLFIPAGSFVDKNGTPIHGEVSLNFNEYHSFGEVMLSGITMKYDSAGVEQDMITGGMFRIEAFQHGEELELADKKRIKVAIASNTGVESMNFYKLNENTGDWTYKQAGTGTKVKRNLLEIPKEKTEIASKSNFNLLDIQVKTDHISALKGKEIVAWKTKETVKSEIKTRLKFSIVGSELFETNEPNQYRLVIQKRTSEEKEKYELIVEPYFTEDAIRDSKIVHEEMVKNMREIDEYKQKMEKNEVVRTIEIASMGVFNWDYLYHRENIKELECYLNFPQNTNTDFVNVFTICPEDNALIRLNFSDKGHYIYDPNKRNCIIAVTKDNRVYYVPNSDFLSQKDETKELKFDFRKSDLVLSTAANFDAQLHRFI